jgi:4-amino-4-deoxy-L-arabinose transferase-like glycosyltransferase
VIDILLLAVILAASAAAGLLVLRLLDARPHATHGDELVVLGLATGLGLTSVIGLALAAVGALRPWPIAVAGAVVLLAGGRDLARVIADVRLPRRPEAWLLLAVCLLLLVAESPTWFAPPVGGDQTKYQLAYPRIYAQAGGLVATPWTFWGAQQWLQNFVFAIAYALRGEDLARLLNATSGVLAALAIAVLVRRHFDRRLGVVAGALFFTMPMCWSLMVRAGADTSLVAYGALAVTAWLDWAGSQRGADLRRTALFAGLAGASKVMGLVIPALVGLGILAVLVRRRVGAARFVSTSLAYGLLALVVLSPCYVRNQVQTGNPIFPFGESIFPGRNWSTAGEAYVNVYYDQYRTREASQRGATPYKGTEVARFPWDLTMHPESFENGKRQGQDVSPFILAFLPALVLVRRRRAAALAVAVIGLAYIAIIAGGAWAHPRYVLPGIALALAAATPAARALCGRRLFAAVVALTIAGNFALISRMLKPMWPDQVRVALGRMKPDDFLARYSDRYVFWRAANRTVPTSGRILVFEKIPHPYYIERPFVLLSYLEQGLVDYRQVNTVPALDAAARQLGATHVAVEEAGLRAAGDPFEAEVTTLWRDYLAGVGEPVLRAGGYALYALPATGANVHG